MRPPTFFADDLRGSEPGGRVTLSERKSRHVRALRLAPSADPRRLPAELAAAFWRRAGRRAVAALEQCGGTRLPDIGPVQELHDYLDRKRRPAPGGGVARSGPEVVLDPAGETSLAGALEAWTGAPPVRILVGPEGGLEAGELAACREAGFRPVHPGPRTLRFETAAVGALAVAGQRAWSDGRSTDGTVDEEVTDG